MNHRVTLYPYQQVLREISQELLVSGSRFLENSRKIEKYGVSSRELVGLTTLCYFRNKLEPGNWVFSTDKEFSDDGIVVQLSDDKNSVEYIEQVEQVYLPGKFLGRESQESVNDYILRQVKAAKGKKGSEYRKDTSLFIFGDIFSKNNQDCFEWQDFVKKFFNEKTFLHLYFLTLLKHAPSHNEYYMLSFTNQKHRQKLNGEFNFKLGTDGIFDFECLQEINLSDPKVDI